MEATIIQQCMRERLPLPKRIENAPQLELGLELYFGAFLDLNTCRPVGMGLAPIRWTDINAYCRELQLSEEQTEDLHFHVRAMDNAFLSWTGNKSPKGKK